MLTTAFVFFSLVASVALKKVDTSPVLLWGTTSTKLSALSVVKSNEFANLMMPLVEKNMVVAFLEHELTNEDLLCVNLQTRNSCYTHLKHRSPLTYYAHVEQPRQALQHIGPVHQHTIPEVVGLPLRFNCEVGVVHMISFKDDIEERSHTLATHDTMIASIDRTLHWYCPVAYLYMSDAQTVSPPVAPVSRHKRASDKNSLNLFVDKLFAVVFESINMIDETGSKKVNISRMEVTQDETDETKLTVRFDEGEISADVRDVDMSGPVSVTLHVIKQGNQHMIKFVDLSGAKQARAPNGVVDVKFKCPDLRTMKKFSYACGSLILRNSGVTLTFKKFQFQGLDGKTDFKNFDQATNCISYITPAIAMGLFIMVILCSILFCGLCWIIDIGRADRFEDPLGPELVIKILET